MVNAFRYGILGISDVNIYFAISMLVAFTLVMYAFAIHLLYRGKGLRH
jgi:ABC-2 type transport system permease protein